MLMTRVLAHTFEILGSKHRDVAEQLAFAPFVLAAYVLVFNVVEVVFFVAMAAEALTSRSNCFTIGTSFHVAPMSVKSVRTLLSNICLVFFEFLLTHHLTTIVCSDYLLVLKVGLNMASCLVVHVKSLSHS